MSLEIIDYKYSGASSKSEISAIIKQKTGLELTSLGSADNYGRESFNVRFPDMEEGQKVNILEFSYNGIFFIDANNHFLCYSIADGLDSYSYVENLYRALVFDFNGKLVNVCYTTEVRWSSTMNTEGSYVEDDTSKSNITLCPLRVYAYNNLNGADSVKAFVKNCYVNYERRFQRGLKFIDQNGNKFMTLGSYLLYKID